ncbi:MAG: amidohydrolase family protein [Deltaproteobacteria bacterium]|nr:amidohydrolase family protein [Deltaproteobacteria bacterium]
MTSGSARAIRGRLDHPILDADGHTVEYLPALIPYFEKAGVADDLPRFFERLFDPGSGMWGALSPEERLRRRAIRPSWWAVPARNTLDFATASMPSLMAERMDELGLDFSVVYTSLGLPILDVPDARLRRACCRALNQFNADVFEGTERRLRPVAVVPMTTPEEAIEELEYAVQTLGFKAVLIASYVRRPIAAVEALGGAVPLQATWVDSFGLDSLYDYDPFWQRCLDLGISPAAHSGANGWDGHRSPTNYMFNHVGFFAQPGETLCRSLFFGGVTKRFPKLRIALLEGGTSWAVRLLHDLVGHYEKRNPESIRHYDPASFDRRVWNELFARHGRRLAAMASSGPDIQQLAFGSNDQSAPLVDEFGACGLESVEDIPKRFVPNFFFGCEADDPLVHHAFDTRSLPGGQSLRAIFGSDVGHWDVPDMRDVLHEAFELVEEERLDAAQFRAFTFENAARFYTDTNPRFFEGTAIESDVAKLLEENTCATGSAALRRARP